MTVTFIAKQGVGCVRFSGGDSAAVAFNIIYHPDEIIGGGVIHGSDATLRRAAAERDILLSCSPDFCLAAIVAPLPSSDLPSVPNGLVLAVFSLARAGLEIEEGPGA